MHRIICPSASLALALAEFIDSEGGTATTTEPTIVLAQAPREVVDAGCNALSFGDAPVSARYRRSHYGRSQAVIDV